MPLHQISPVRLDPVAILLMFVTSEDDVSPRFNKPAKISSEVRFEPVVWMMVNANRYVYVSLFDR
jgi:hypothetical protein